MNDAKVVGNNALVLGTAEPPQIEQPEEESKLGRQVSLIEQQASSVVVARISSISARFEDSPKMSMSHCMNWRKRPLWGLSARHTLPIWRALKGEGSWAALLE